MILLATPAVWTGVLIAAAVIAGLLALVVVAREFWRAGRPRPRADHTTTDDTTTNDETRAVRGAGNQD